LTRASRPCSRSASAILVVCALAVILFASPAASQTYSSFFNRFSPFLTWPPVQGEITLTPIYMWVAGGQQTIPSLGISWSLRDDFALTNGHVFLDGMLRFQLGRLSLRAHVNTRDFDGTKKFRDLPAAQSSVARFEYSGYRLGGDIDILQFGNSRIGVNLDQDLYSPVFTESIQTAQGGKKLLARSPVTIGGHVVLRPAPKWYGFSALFEARARWPVAGADLTDWYVSAGIQGSETYIGTMGVRAGYRSTTISFSDAEFFNNQEVSMNFKAVMEGVFGEFVYYY